MKCWSIFSVTDALVRALADRHHRRLVQHDALFTHVDEGVGSSQVDREIAREQPPEILEHRGGQSGLEVAGRALGAVSPKRRRLYRSALRAGKAIHGSSAEGSVKCA
jgi:hypothetical protein